MQNRVLLVGLTSMLAFACGTSVDPEYETAVLVLPHGDPEAGRQVFIDLGVEIPSIDGSGCAFILNHFVWINGVDLRRCLAELITRTKQKYP